MWAWLRGFPNLCASTWWRPTLIVHLFTLYFYNVLAYTQTTHLLTSIVPTVPWLLPEMAQGILCFGSLFSALGFGVSIIKAPCFILFTFDFSLLREWFRLIFLTIFTLGSDCLKHSAFTLVTFQWAHCHPRVNVMRAWPELSPSLLRELSSKPVSNLSQENGESSFLSN